MVIWHMAMPIRTYGIFQGVSKYSMARIKPGLAAAVAAPSLRTPLPQYNIQYMIGRMAYGHVGI